jgi:hypothetical protein
MIVRGLLVVGLVLAGSSGLHGQAAVEPVLGRVQEAWLGHRTHAVVEGSDTVRLRLPGLATTAAVRPGQAVRLLDEYLADAEELSFRLTGVRYAGSDHAYAEFARSFKVRGTADQRTETVFLGYRWLAGQWRLCEVRVAP